MVSKALYEVPTAIVGARSSSTVPGATGKKRGALGMLADMEARMIKNDTWVLATDDIRNAFDNVPIDKTIEAHRQLFKQDAIFLPETE